MPLSSVIWDITKCKLYVDGVIYLTSSGWVVMYFISEWFPKKIKLCVAGVGCLSYLMDNIVYSSALLRDLPRFEVVAVL